MVSFSRSLPEEKKAAFLSGFTLIELLVVIAIIAILAAILFPVFAQARAKARQTACIADMKQIGMGIQQYTNDYDGVIPPAFIYESSPRNTDGPMQSWPSLIYSFVKNEDIFVCPGANDDKFKIDPAYFTTTRLYTGVTTSQIIDIAFPAAPGGDGSTCAKKAGDTKCSPSLPGNFCLVNRLSYSRNTIPAAADSWTTAGAAFYGNGPKNGFVGEKPFDEYALSEADVKSPASTIMLVDGMSGDRGHDCRALGAFMRAIQDDTQTDYNKSEAMVKPDYRHNGGYVLLYGDGHAGWKKWGSTNPCDWSVQEDVCN